MSQIHISEIKGLDQANIKQIRAVNPDCSFSLEEVDFVRTLGSKFDMGMVDVICKGRCKNLPIRIYVQTLLELAKKDRKNINLILSRKRKYFHVEEVSNG